MRIQILLLIKAMRICDLWSIGPPELCFEPLKLLNFHRNIIISTSVADPHHFNTDPDLTFHSDSSADPDPAFYSNADPDPAFHSNADTDPASHQSHERHSRALF
jgi:hypothetical protein